MSCRREGLALWGKAETQIERFFVVGPWSTLWCLRGCILSTVGSPARLSSPNCNINKCFDVLVGDLTCEKDTNTIWHYHRLSLRMQGLFAGCDLFLITCIFIGWFLRVMGACSVRWSFQQSGPLSNPFNCSRLCIVPNDLLKNAKPGTMK